MAERRIRRTAYTSRGRFELFRARHTAQRATMQINDVQPPDDPHWRDFYELLSMRYTQRVLGASYRIAP